ncbi:MAG TPA: cation-transporting P-type ATPase, partial [Gammaproteobacteria bacterium]|nr:cation-transporting P-type ATPase [Gammaproteobacteria bacterium]
MDARQKGEFYNPRKEFKLSKEEQQSKLYLTKIKPSSEYFNSGHQKNNIDTAELMQEHPRPVSFISLPGKIPNRWFFLENFFLTLLKETYETLWFTFSFDKIDFTRVKNFLLPFGMASAAYGLESFLSHQIGKLITGSDSFDFIPKLALSGYILNKSAKHCLTNTPTFSPKDFYIATSLELFAIINLYTSTLTGTQKILNHQFDDAYILLTSLALSGLVVPSMIAHWVQKQEKIFFQNEFENGSQRSVSALVSSGLTPAANTFFQFYALLRRELSISRGFQLGLISNNIIVDRGISRQLRNLPSMLIDLIPQVFRKLFIQLDKIDDDFKKNMSKIFVLQLGFIPPKFEEKKIVELKTGDLVWCGKNIDFSCVPISGEIFSFERDFHGNYILDAKEPREVRVNLKNYTGENIWIKNHTRAFNINDYHEIDQRAIQDHKQIGILNGAEIDFLGKHANFFIRIARKKEYIMDRSYEKKSVINEIINQYKTHNIILAVGGSIFSAVIMKGTPLQILLRSVKLLFSIFQMMIPFSESFLREMVNSQIIKKINYVIPDMPLDISDALRICDFWNTLSGYYSDKFPGGAVIISDKTGTLTTTRMKALGIWSKDMGNQIDFTHPLEQFKKSHYIYSSDIQQLRNAFELFASIYTNNNKAFEPEEHAILRLFKKILQDAQCLKIEEVGYHHFKKILNFGQMEKQIETYHLGLFTNYGGRFTICVDDQKKYLLFCGIPRVLKFNNSELFKDYNLMPVRKNVLSRDWCVARREISNDWYENAIRAFHQNDSASIEALLDEEMIRQLEFNCTFLVDNPVKKGVDKFISQCKNIQVPVIIATGDTAKAAQNIARVLCPEQSEDMMTVRSEEAAEAHFPYENLAKKSIIFAGINDAVFKQLDRLITIKIAERPNIIFSEMTTKDKGILIQYFKKAKYFTVANGDGSNDIAMMKKADLVIGHL